MMVRICRNYIFRSSHHYPIAKPEMDSTSVSGISTLMFFVRLGQQWRWTEAQQWQQSGWCKQYTKPDCNTCIHVLYFPTTTMKSVTLWLQGVDSVNSKWQAEKIDQIHMRRARSTESLRWSILIFHDMSSICWIFMDILIESHIKIRSHPYHTICFNVRNPQKKNRDSPNKWEVTR